jgi:hypothetical protein
MSTQQDVLDFYTRPGAMTAAGRWAPWFDALPRDVADLCRIVQGLAIHEHMAFAYGLVIEDDRQCESHIRSVERMLERLFAIDPQPLTIARPPEKRLVGVCRHFVLLLVAMLRAKGVPARARCGFGTYFNPGSFEDHWVCEYWNATESRWILADPQFDQVWRAKLKIDHDVLDVPRDRFLIAADAWTQCRTGKADSAKFGIGDLRGLWFVAGNLVRDAAALNNMEMLPWDVWGVMPPADRPLRDDQLAFFDRLAMLTRTPDTSLVASSMKAMTACACRRPSSTPCDSGRRRFDGC